MKKRAVGRNLLLLLLALALLIAAYAVYVFASWNRLEDRLPLEVTPAGSAVNGDVEPGRVYRLISYNVGFGAYSDDYSFFMDGGKESRARSAEAAAENITGAMGEVQALDGDFVLIQEVDVDGTRSYHVDELALIRQLIGDTRCSVFAQNYDSPYLLWPLSAPHGANRAGQAAFSRYYITSAQRRSLPIEGGVMKVVDLDRCYSVSRIPVVCEGDEKRELVLYNLHLSAYTSDGEIAEEQMEMLFADMLAEYEAGNYAVAGGDFNKDLLGGSDEIFGVSGEEYTWAQAIPPEIIPEGLRIVPPFDEENPVPSCRNADRPYGPDSYVVTVDGFVVSDNVTVLAASVEDTGFRWSDHNPVYMDFQLQS